MALVPSNKPGKLAFFRTRQTPWQSNAVAIGTTAAAVTNLIALLDDANDKYDAQLAAQELARAATVTADAAFAALGTAGADIIAQIRAKGRTGGDAVYALALIPPPAAPQPVGPLGKPSDFSVTLDETGVLNLKWKNTNPTSATGVTYQIWRRNSPTAEFTYLGGTGEKAYPDDTLPAGSSQVTYQLQATRSTSVGPWAQFNVNFGVSSSGFAIVKSITESEPSKIAA